jgi:hypothetical protein
VEPGIERGDDDEKEREIDAHSEHEQRVMPTTGEM